MLVFALGAVLPSRTRQLRMQHRYAATRRLIEADPLPALATDCTSGSSQTELIRMNFTRTVVGATS